ncbi:hypothetical protein LIA77_04579 [Sarocladium implicatum]|nr:hypothetical protein LIA77_04579 [Sarocladium implicatum]
MQYRQRAKAVWQSSKWAVSMSRGNREQDNGRAAGAGRQAWRPGSHRMGRHRCGLQILLPRLSALPSLSICSGVDRVAMSRAAKAVVGAEAAQPEDEEEEAAAANSFGMEGCQRMEGRQLPVPLPLPLPAASSVKL